MRQSVLTSKSYQSYVKHVEDKLKSSGKTFEAVELNQGPAKELMAAGLCLSLSLTGSGSAHHPVDSVNPA